MYMKDIKIDGWAQHQNIYKGLQYFYILQNATICREKFSNSDCGRVKISVIS